MELENGLKTVKLSSPDLSRSLENGIRMGEPLLIEDMEDHLEPLLEPILLKQFKIVSKRKMVKIVD